MKIEDYLAGNFTGKPCFGDRGKESDWLDLCEFALRSPSLHVVDPCYASDPREGCLVALPPGIYRVQARAIAYGRDVRISRLRATRSDAAAVTGPEIGYTGSDTANIGIYDFEVFSRAWGVKGKSSWETIRPTLEGADTHGVAVLDEAVGAVMPFVSSGFGDGTFPIHEFRVDGSRVGFEVTFVRADAGYPF